MKNLPNNNEDIENLGMRNSTIEGCIETQKKNIRSSSSKDVVSPSHLWDPAQLHWSSSARDKQDKEGGTKLPFWRNHNSVLLFAVSVLWIVAFLLTVSSNGDGEYCTFQKSCETCWHVSDIRRR